MHVTGQVRQLMTAFFRGSWQGDLASACCQERLRLLWDGMPWLRSFDVHTDWCTRCCRREDSIPASAADAGGSAAVIASPAAAVGAGAGEMEAARQKALDAEEARKRAREQEQADLEEEMEKRRKRIEAWQVGASYGS